MKKGTSRFRAGAGFGAQEVVTRAKAHACPRPERDVATGRTRRPRADVRPKAEDSRMQPVRFIGLDVHKDTITIAVAEAAGGPPEVLAMMPSDAASLIRRLKKLGPNASLRCAYEAKPTGFGIYRALKAAGIDCVVIAPSKVPTTGNEQVKTDRRDACRLARFLRSGDLVPIHVPDEVTEAVRDLERARGDALEALRVARQQLNRFLLRHGRVYSGGVRRWCGIHLDWIRSQTFEHEAHNRVLVDYVKTVDDCQERVKRLTKDLEDVVQAWSQRPWSRPFKRCAA